MAKVKRLFKVAKELNVATTVLVDRLHKEGCDIANTPMAKIPGEMYELLLNDFASDKKLKEKAAEIIEKRNEERERFTKVEPAPIAPPSPKPDVESDIITAAELRESAAIAPKTVEIPKEKTPKVEPVVEKAEVKPIEKVEPQAKVIEEKAKPPVEEKPKEEAKPKEEVKAKEEKKEDVEPPKERKPALKIIGKLDLDSIEKKPKAKKDKASPKVESPKPKEEVKAPIKGRVQAPKETKKETPAPEPKKKSKPSSEEKPVEKKINQSVITATENAPKLSGLKVLGTMKLEEPKKKGPAGKTDAGATGAKRKRKRKRRRKKVDTTGTAQNTAGQKQGKKGVVKASKQEVQSSVRSTLNQMGKSGGRQRQQLRRAKRDEVAARREERMKMVEAESRIVELTEFITANEFSNILGVPVNEVIKLSFELGKMVTINQRLDKELIEILASEFGFEVNFVDVKEQDFFDGIEIEDSPESLVTRNPIVTVMGHVDHGKTTLLDYLRKANVAGKEAGGITQHIGAYSVQMDDSNSVTFLDTPGHEAFTAMRARGAQVTDLAIIVIAADDAVMPQTKEAITHAQAADIPMIFAFNKMDKPGADSNKIRTQLSEMNILVEDWGGEYQCHEISALKGDGVAELLEKVILQAELLELKANPDRIANGSVIESRVDRGRGNVTTMLVQNGTLNVGDVLVGGVHFGKIKALIDQKGKRIKSATPSIPVQVLGMNGQPSAGDKFQVFPKEAAAKEVAQKRSELFREQSFRAQSHITLETLVARQALDSFSELKIILKGDMDGSVEALTGALLKLSIAEVEVVIILKGIGAITENDVNLAAASDALIIAFNTRPTAKARMLADKEKVEIRTYSVIYNAINDVKDAMEGLLSPELREEAGGTAEVREVFKVTKVGTVAGCMVTSGKINRNDLVRVIRDGIVIYTSKMSSLKRFKDDAKDVANGFECGIMVENYADIKVGDQLETYTERKVKRKLKQAK